MAASSSTSKVTDDFDGFNTKLQKALLTTTRLANGLPSSSDLQYQRTLSRPLGKKVDGISKRLLHLTAQMLDIAKQGTAQLDKKGKGKSRATGELQEEDLIDGYENSVVAVTDHLLELMDTNLDEHKRSLLKGNLVTKDQIPAVGTSGAAHPPGRLAKELLNSTTTPKSQLLFTTKLDNSRNALFTPLLPDKPHATSPLDFSAQTRMDPLTGNEVLKIPNPYEQEVGNALQQPLPTLDMDMTESSDAELERMTSRMSDKPFMLVDTVEKLEQCVEKLKQAKVIAVDLEHHDYRSYRGFACLMQISTTTDDFIVDLLVPSIRTSAHMLNQAFADPGIVKVLHGAEMDIIWLQRDFGVYVVNLFDTFHASKVIGRTTGHGLASLLLEYTTFVADKRYQLADWRIRPLPEEMLHYARSDTHFLIHIYQKLLDNPVLNEESIAEIRRRSATTAKQAYEHGPYDLEHGSGYGGWRNLVERAGKGPLWGLDEPTESTVPLAWINAKGMVSLEVFKAVHNWRDGLARDLDESPRYILSNKAIFSLADAPPQDSESMERVLGTDLKEIVRERKDELVGIIVGAKAFAEKEVARRREVASKREEQEKAAFAATSATATGSSATSGTPAAQSAPTVSASALFGQANQPMPTSTSSAMSSAVSSLFGGDKARLSNQPSAFAAVLAKVHSSMLEQISAAVIPTASTFLKPSKADQESVAETEQGNGMDIDNGSKITVLDPDHTFVSKQNRSKPAAAQEPEDEIVTVSSRPKNKGKKRKEQENGASINSKPEEEAIIPFDYSTSKSVLDAPANAAGDGDGRKQKKQKKEKGAKDKNSIIDGFRPAPKSMNNPKAGNKSHTFS